VAAPNSLWWRGGVIYQIYPRSFADGNGDGIGDLAGITRRLDHVASLGVDAIWLSPFFKSPMKDFGYDVADYNDVDPMFGTLADFKALVARAHALGLKVMIDQVLSHSSDQHPWFVESRASRTNAKADWYVWADAKHDGTPPNNWLSVFGGSAWQWDTRRRQYYLHNFLTSQPDLNFHNPAVQEALLASMQAWLELGVDGFRLDAINYCFHDATAPAANPYSWQIHQYDKTQPEALDFLRRVRALVDRYPGTTLLGEIGDEAGMALVAEYSGPDRLHMGYCFDLLSPEHSAAHVRRIIERFESVGGEGWPCWALSNHDCERIATRWGGATPPPALLRLAAALAVGLRGSLCVYQGEELGLPEADIAFEDLQDPYGITMWPEYKGRDGCRTPMPWDSTAPDLGFGSGGTRPWLPLAESHRALAVDRQEAEPGSLLNHFCRLLHWRRSQPALRLGSLTLLAPHAHVLAFVRQHGSERLLCAFNLSDQACVFAPGLAGGPGRGLAEGGTQGARIEGHSVSFDPYGVLFARLD
jgi:alpha-glucosidase